MARHEQPIPDGPLADLARGLRALRDKAGLTYREMHKITGLSVPTLSTAAGGRKLPSLAVVLAYTTACEEKLAGAEGEDAADGHQAVTVATVTAAWQEARKRWQAAKERVPKSQPESVKPRGSRSDRSLPPGPLGDLARALRQLKEDAGLSYRQLATKAYYSASTLATAAGGEEMPSEKVIRAYAKACGADPEKWAQRRTDAITARAKAHAKPATAKTAQAGRTVGAGPGWVAALNMVKSPSQLTDRLNELRAEAGLSYGALSARAKKHNKNLSKSTISSILTGSRVPTTETLATFLQACGVSRRIALQWIAAADRARAAAGRRPRPAGKVSDRDLGVHAPTDLPYVPRGIDATLRAAITTAAAFDGALIIVHGDLGAGKTRCAAQAIRALQPGTTLLRPADLDELASFAASPRPSTALNLVWLDDLRKFAAGSIARTLRTIFELLADDSTTVVIATASTALYAQLAEAYDSSATEGMLRGVHLPDMLTDAELEDAAELAQHDYRLATVAATGTFRTLAFNAATAHDELLPTARELGLDISVAEAMTRLTHRGHASASAKPSPSADQLPAGRHRKPRDPAGGLVNRAKTLLRRLRSPRPGEASPDDRPAS